MRLDSQYFSKDALTAEAKIKASDHTSLEAVTSSIESFGAYDLTNKFSYQESGIPFLRCLNIKKGAVDFSDALHISEEANKLLWKSEVKPEMVLLTMSGSVGNSAVALPDWNYPINSNQDIAKIATQNGYSPYALAAFFSSYYGQIQMQRLPVGSVQQHIFLWMIGELVVPRFSSTFQQAVESVMKNAYVISASSQDLYTQAETLLLTALGLNDWQPPEPLAYQSTFKSAFAAGRLDAEHFQPKYAALLEHLQNGAGGCVQLGQLCPNPVNGVEVREYEEEGVPYLRVGDIQHFSVKAESVVYISQKDATREIEKVRLRAGDVLVSRSGSLGVIGVVEPKWADAVISSHLIRVRLEDAEFDPYYVAAFLSSRPGKMQIKQHSNGGVQPEINQPALKSLVIPKLPTTQQEQIRASILAGHTARRRAKVLLEAAKRAVEVAIEENEAAAMQLLQAAQEERDDT